MKPIAWSRWTHPYNLQPTARDERGAADAGARASKTIFMNPPSPTGLPDFNALWDYERPEETEAEVSRPPAGGAGVGGSGLLPAIADAGGAAQGLQRKYDAAHATLDHVRDLMTADLHGRARAIPARCRGRCFNDTGNAEPARTSFLEAWEVARERGLDGYAVDAAHMMGIIEPAAAEALAWNERAVACANDSSDPAARRWLATLQNNIGWTYYGMGRHVDALRMFEAALVLRREQGKAGSVRIARYAVAKARRALGQVEECWRTRRGCCGSANWCGSRTGTCTRRSRECLIAPGRKADACGALCAGV